MKYGGMEIGSSLSSFANALLAGAAGQLEAMSGTALTDAGYQRRAEGWEHQRAIADHELEQLDRGIAIAKIRASMAERSRDIHDETERQNDEIIDRYQDKLTGLGLFTFMASQLTRLHRNAFESALSLARLAARALRYERDDSAPGLSGECWEGKWAGLLSGERLLFDLNRLEAWFLETHHRRLEVDQTFSLTQIAPEALWALKEQGACAFALPELFFDLLYPGHYDRKIRAVRVSIPAVVGPSTSIAATLELTASSIARAADGQYEPIPAQHTTRIATSSAQNDAGLFELSFGDARYLPFEGAGAISQWTLRLPTAVRSFDYQSIDDVLIHVAYTARYDEAWRGTIEGALGGAVGRIVSDLGDHGYARVISFRRELGATLSRLVRSPAGTEVPFEIKQEHFPFLLRGRTLAVTSAYLALSMKGGAAPARLDIELDGVRVPSFDTTPERAGLPSSQDLAAVFTHGLLGEHRLRIAGDGARDAIDDVRLYLDLAIR